MPVDIVTVPRSTGHPGYSVKVSRIPEAVPKARALARTVISTWGLEELADDAALLLTELMTNAVRHARGTTVRILIERPAQRVVYLAVVDRAPRHLPAMRTPHFGEGSGRGLLLVSEMATAWGCDLMGAQAHPWGKRVWALLEAE